MSLLHALDPGASPSRPGCEARGCRSTSTTSVRAYLGRPHATTIRVCETHRRALEVAGELEHPVNCLIPECGRVRATPSRLCAQHEAIVAAAKITIPRKGVIGAETLLAVRRAVEAEEKRQATIAAAPPVRPLMEEPAPDYLGACWEHLRDHVAGGTRIDMAVAEVVGLLKQTRKNLARREKDWESAVQIAELRGDEVRAASAALTALGVPMIQADPAEPQYDLVARIKRLAMRPTVQPEPVPADVLQPEAIAAQRGAADLIMAALNGRLAEMPAGVELSLQLALTGVVGIVASERGAVAQRDALEQTIQAIGQELDNDGAPEIDGKTVKTIADRIGALIGRWQDEIRETICAVVPAPDRIDGGACDSGDPLDLTLAEVAQGLTQLQEQIDAQKAAQPAPAVQADPPAGWPPSWDDLTPNLNVWRRLQAGHSFYLPATEEGRLAAWVLTGWRPGADGAALAEAERVAGLNPGITWVAEALEGIAGPGVYPHRDYMPTRMLRLLEEVSDDRARMAVVRRERDQLKADLAALQACPTVQPDPLRVQATPAEGFGIAIEWTLDTVEAPRAPTISDRITALAGQRDELRAHLVAIREALNVGPASDSDVRLETPLEELARIVRARTVCMLEERDQRVALAEEVEALKKTLGDPLAPAVKALVAWLDLPTGAALLEQMIRAVAKHTVPPEAAIRALHSEEEMARIILSTPEPFGVPF